MAKTTAERTDFLLSSRSRGENDSHKSQVLCAPDTPQNHRWLLSYADGTLKPHFPKHGTEYALGGEGHYTQQYWRCS